MSGFDDLAAGGVLNFDSEAYVKGTAPRYVGNPYGNNNLPFDGPLAYPGFGITPGPYLSGAPVQDAFNDKGYNYAKKPIPWGSIATVGIVASLATWAGVKVKSKFFPKKEVKNEKPVNEKSVNKKVINEEVAAKQKISAAKDTQNAEELKNLIESEETPAKTTVNNEEAKVVENKPAEVPVENKQIVETPKQEVPKAETPVKQAEPAIKAETPKLEKPIEAVAKKAPKKGFFAKLPKRLGIVGLVGVGILGIYEAVKILRAKHQPAQPSQMSEQPQG
jgi:hypothetical protein